MQKIKKKLRVLHYPQVPCKPFFVDVKDEEQALLIRNTLANQHLFLYENNIIPDYANAISVVMWDENSDGEGTPDWVDYYNEEENMEFDEFVETYLSIEVEVEKLVEKEYPLNVPEGSNVDWQFRLGQREGFLKGYKAGN